MFFFTNTLGFQKSSIYSVQSNIHSQCIQVYSLQALQLYNLQVLTLYSLQVLTQYSVHVLTLCSLRVGH